MRVAEGGVGDKFALAGSAHELRTLPSAARAAAAIRAIRRARYEKPMFAVFEQGHWAIVEIDGDLKRRRRLLA
jgi:hypothetical protein